MDKSASGLVLHRATDRAGETTLRLRIVDVVTHQIDHSTAEPELPSGQLTLPAPPRLEPGEGVGGVLAGAVPMLGGLGSILVVAMLAGGGSGSTIRTRSLLAGGVFLVATLTYIVVQVDRQRRQQARQLTATRADYLEQLAQARAQARAAGADQRRALVWHHPSPQHLPRERSRLWVRGPQHPLFLHLRLGRSTQPLAIDLVEPGGTASTRADPVAVGALKRLIAVHSCQPNLPLVLELRGKRRIHVTGPVDRRRALARALVCHATAAHSPAHLGIAVLCAEGELTHWEWLKWLPHTVRSQQPDEIGPQQRGSTEPALLPSLLPESSPALLIVDGSSEHPLPHPLPSAVTVLDLGGSADSSSEVPDIRIDLSGPTHRGRIPLALTSRAHVPERGFADQLDLQSAEAYARLLTPLADVPGTSDPPTTKPISTLTGLLGTPTVDRYDPASFWGTHQGDDFLRVPIGTDDAGLPVHLDLKESAHHGMGPHGLVIGATGSGKSELLRTLVLGLAMTHSPEQLNLVLVDFKGGATFAGLAGLPHTSAVITNLASELTLIDRMQDALTGEMIRRQELLRSAGNHASVRDYERARLAGRDCPPLPSLFIVVDEFSELLTANPEFIELFVAIGRLGRSLGLHLLLASQRLEEGRLRGLESHLSYRIGLRTFSASESRTVLGVPDAHQLPPLPGLGYLRPDPSTLTRFRAAYASGTATEQAPIADQGDKESSLIQPFTLLRTPERPAQTSPQRAPVSRTQSAGKRAEDKQAVGPPSVIDAVVGRMSGQGTPAHRVWLPPLDRPDTLDQLMPDLTLTTDLGLISPSWRAQPGLRVPVGTVDQPRKQHRGDVVVDMAGATGHVAVVGGPRSGRSTLLRTLVAGLALTRTPREIQVFLLDFGGGCGPLARLPHVSGSATRSEPDVVRRIVAEITGILDRREQTFARLGVDSIESYRSRAAQGPTEDSVHDGYGDLILVIDGWATLRADFDDLEQDVQALASRGLAYGVHVLVTSGRWADFRAATRDLFGTRLELRLGDPSESEMNRRSAAHVPVGRPGRGLNARGLQILTALPRIDGEAEPDTATAGLEDLVRRVSHAWSGPPAPPLRLLPERADQASLLTQVPADAPGFLLGVEEKQLLPVMLDPQREPHLLVLGDACSGKSATLRGYLREVQRTRTPGQAQVVLVDYRRSLLGEVQQDYLLNYLTNGARAGTVLQDLAGFLQDRLPGDTVSPAQLRQRTWWTGAEVHVVVDDYDLVSTPSSSPVAALQPLLAQARDVGLHLVVARRSGGASRAMYDPILQSLRDLAQPGLLLSGDPDEGPLLGRLRPQPAPPGRGRLLTRDHGVRVVQVAWTEPTEP